MGVLATSALLQPNLVTTADAPDLESNLLSVAECLPGHHST